MPPAYPKAGRQIAQLSLWEEQNTNPLLNPDAGVAENEI
jgi:hypothetical protein